MISFERLMKQCRESFQRVEKLAEARAELRVKGHVRAEEHVRSRGRGHREEEITYVFF